jgi:6-phosphogluconolactonase
VTKLFMAIFAGIGTAAVAAAQPEPDSWRVYTGTYTRGESEGIYLLNFNAETGALSLEGVAAETENPSFLALHPGLPVLYAVGEMSSGGTVSAYRIDDETGKLDPLNQESSQGGGPCHVAVKPDGSQVAVANYGGGNVAVLPIDDEGKLSEATSFFQHEGSGPNERRQEKAHAHAVVYSADGKHLVVADLGTDQLRVYENQPSGDVVPLGPPYPATAPGAGPRHFEFHPTLPYAYSINELDNTVTVFSWYGEGGLAPVQTIATLPDDFTAENTTAEIAIHPTGNYLYASNRGHDSIVAYAINEDGRLSLIGHTSTGGKTPRNFAIAPGGKFVLAANQNSDNVVVLRVNAKSGGLEPTGIEVIVPTPVCLVFTQP